MVGEAFDRYVPLRNPDDTLNDADVQLLAFEDSTLFDMQLEVGVDIPLLSTNGLERCGIATQKAYAVRDGLAAVGPLLELFLRKLAAQGVTADGPAFLIRKDNDLQRVDQVFVRFRDRLRDFDRGHGADVTIVVSACGHRV